MCSLFASTPPESYAFATRSVRLNGQSTSIRLEKAFWGFLEEIAADEGYSVPRFIAAPGDSAAAGGSPEFHLAPPLHLPRGANRARARRGRLSRLA
jgi:hypothetical protein